jgi:hypothetical protein
MNLQLQQQQQQQQQNYALQTAVQCEVAATSAAWA